VQRGDLELLAARPAHHLVVDADQVIAQLRELRAIAFVGARRQAILLHASDPSHGVLVGAMAARARVSRRPVFGFVVEERTLVESHAHHLMPSVARRWRFRQPNVEHGRVGAGTLFATRRMISSGSRDA
jgi:hypothetical protein